MRIRALGVVLTVLALVGAGCGAQQGSEPPPEAPPASSPAVQPAAPKTPERLSKDAYQKLLTGSEQTVRKAFDRAMAAPSLRDLSAAAKELSGALVAAYRQFDSAVPPSDAASAHNAALPLLDANVTGFDGGDTEANECGIKPSAAEQLINAKQQIHEAVDAAELKTVAGRYTKVGYAWGKKLLPAKPADPKVKKRRADNGEIIDRNGSRGYNVLQITNDTDGDVVIAAVTKNPKKPMASIYVRAGKTTTLEGLAAKKYTVYYKSGTDWDDDKMTFTRNCAFSKFRQSFTPESNWRIELQPRIGGNAPTDETDPF
jgi:hypothetical protein